MKIILISIKTISLPFALFSVFLLFSCAGAPKPIAGFQEVDRQISGAIPDESPTSLSSKDAAAVAPSKDDSVFAEPVPHAVKPDKLTPRTEISATNAVGLSDSEEQVTNANSEKSSTIESTKSVHIEDTIKDPDIAAVLEDQLVDKPSSAPTLTEPSIEIIDFSGKEIGKAFPDWIYSDPHDLESLPEYQSWYLFRIEETTGSKASLAKRLETVNANTAVAAAATTRLRKHLRWLGADENDTYVAFLKAFWEGMDRIRYNPQLIKSTWLVRRFQPQGSHDSTPSSISPFKEEAVGIFLYGLKRVDFAASVDAVFIRAAALASPAGDDERASLDKLQGQLLNEF